MLNQQDRHVATYLHWVKGVPQKEIADLLEVTAFEVDMALNKVVEKLDALAKVEASSGDRITFLYQDRRASGVVEKQYTNSVLVRIIDVDFPTTEDENKTVVNHKRYEVIDIKKIPKPSMPKRIQEKLRGLRVS
ncbi:YkvS family protein [Bacillus cereus]|uniref:YkvS family protein n=1 Tax=Bacillus cereus TaxID=1396 RepID=UPI00211DC5FA|nr:YkvS family protein [Bacillus cereus]